MDILNLLILIYILIFNKSFINIIIIYINIYYITFKFKKRSNFYYFIKKSRILSYKKS